jgi:hypothetical protein
MDVDGDGSLSVDELRFALRERLGLKLSDGDLGLLLRRCDDDDNAEVDLEEFARFVAGGGQVNSGFMRACPKPMRLRLYVTDEWFLPGRGRERGGQASRGPALGIASGLRAEAVQLVGNHGGVWGGTFPPRFDSGLC